MSASKRGTSNSNSRGSAKDRRIRKQWLLDFFGDGTHAKCSFCPTLVDFDTISVDRYPIPGCEGGTYKRGNIRPACESCNSSDGGKLGSIRKAAKILISV